MKKQIKVLCLLLILSTISNADWPILHITSNSPIHQSAPYIDGDKLIFTDFEGKTDQGYISDDLPNLKWFDLAKWTEGYIIQDDGGTYKDYDGVPFEDNVPFGVGSRCVTDGKQALYAHAKYDSSVYKWILQIAQRDVTGGVESVWFSVTNFPDCKVLTPAIASTGIVFSSKHDTSYSDYPQIYWLAAPGAQPNRLSTLTNRHVNRNPWTYQTKTVWERRPFFGGSEEKWDVMTADAISGGTKIIEPYGNAYRQWGVSINERGIAWNREVFGQGDFKTNFIRFLPNGTSHIETIYTELADSIGHDGHLRWGRLWGNRWIGIREAGNNTQDIISVHLDTRRIEFLGKIPSESYFKDMYPTLCVSDDGVVPVAGQNNIFLFLRSEIREAVSNGLVWSKNVTLDFSAPGAKYIKIANTTSDWAAVPWQNYTNVFDWTLATDSGNARVWFQFHYANANIDRKSSLGWDDVFVTQEQGSVSLEIISPSDWILTNRTSIEFSGI